DARRSPEDLTRNSNALGRPLPGAVAGGSGANLGQTPERAAILLAEIKQLPAVSEQDPAAATALESASARVASNALCMVVHTPDPLLANTQLVQYLKDNRIEWEPVSATSTLNLKSDRLVSGAESNSREAGTGAALPAYQSTAAPTTSSSTLAVNDN